MKKILAFLLALSLLLITGTAFAHPGRTDSKGGHHCRTNCEKWGYEYGAYHYHNEKITDTYKTTKNKTAKKEAKKSARQKAK